jgi:hypothetical protein
MKIGWASRVKKVVSHWRREPAGEYGLGILEEPPIVALNGEQHAGQSLGLLDVPPGLVL